MPIQPKIAIGNEFLQAFSSVPQNIQKKVSEFLTKFRENPTSSGINYEKIHAAADKNLRSVRIDQDYRGIVLQPETGDTYVMLWVDKHDKAYKWAKNKKCIIHPETGSLQLIDVSKAENFEEKDKPTENKNKFLFSHLKDRQLLKLGVPEIYLDSVKKLENEEELERLKEYLPEEAYEGLFFIMAGDSYEKIINEREMAKVEEDDFGKALTHPDSKRRFYIIEEASELSYILNYPLEKWRVFLHPMQQRLAEKNFNGPARVLGEAGTGKTVLAMHRAKYLADKVFNKEGDKILFTTFTKNLAADIKSNLEKICNRETLNRIKVINIDRWIADFLKANDYDFTIIFDHNNENVKILWDEAVLEASEYDSKFLREEWEQVIQANGITTWEEYKSVPRVGRKHRLSRSDKKKIWKVFEKYRELLSKHSYKEWMDAVRDVRVILKNSNTFMPFKSVIVDEAQDMNPEIFKLLRALIPEGKNDIFITGDAHQRIYKNNVVLSKCGIKIVGRSYKLKVNYRTTEEIRNFAVKILEGYSFDDLDGGIDEISKIESLTHGEEPKIINCPDFQSSVDEIKNIIKELENENVNIRNICIVTRSNKLCEQYIGALKAFGIKTYKLKRSEPDDRTQEGIRIGTMHRVKGLEFEYMIVVAQEEHLLAYKHIDITEKSLFYVSCTRAKIGVWVIIL